MFYSLLADSVVCLHFGFVLFVVGGGVLAWRWPRWVWVHVPAALWAVLVEWSGWICPLTPLENWLRTQAAQATYSTGFVEHYLGPLLYPEDLTRPMQWALGALVAALNLGLYTGLWWRWKCGQRRAETGQCSRQNRK